MNSIRSRLPGAAGTDARRQGRKRWPSLRNWTVSPRGIGVVIRLDLRRRVRSSRWRLALVLWCVAVGAVTVLTIAATGSLAAQGYPGSGLPTGRSVFGTVVFFVLFLGILLAPTLSSSAINGDRENGTLAGLQVTLLTPAEIVLGKLLAAWLAALTFLIAGLPFIVWALHAGGVSVRAFLAATALIAVLLLVACALGIGFSAAVRTTSGSTAMTYLATGGLCIVTVILFGLGSAIQTQEERIRVWTAPATSDWGNRGPVRCAWEYEEVSRTHSERVWWLLAVNPFVIVADATGFDASRAAEGTAGSASGRDRPAFLADPLGAIRYSVRAAHTGPALEADWCGAYGSDGPSPVPERDLDDSDVWPWGLGIDAILGLGAVTSAIRRLRVPAGVLPRGTRIA